MTNKYLHVEKNPDKVYFSNESPELKKWNEDQIKRLNRGKSND